MEWDDYLIRWALLTLLFGLAMGGKPWIFPQEGGHGVRFMEAESLVLPASKAAAK